MPIFRLPILTFALLIARCLPCANADAAVSREETARIPTTHGVSLELLDKYTPSQSNPRFTCIKDTSLQLSWDKVNDDFCDCPDGSDEPGTSACAGSFFYCQNVGHIPARIPSNRVSDGVCEPECCDGSDERYPTPLCPNVCEQVATEYKAIKEKETKRIRDGVKIRQEHLDYAKTHFEQQSQTFETLNTDIQNLGVKLKELEKLKEIWKDVKRVDKKCSANLTASLFKRIASQKERVATLEHDHQTLVEALHEFGKEIESLKALPEDKVKVLFEKWELIEGFLQAETKENGDVQTASEQELHELEQISSEGEDEETYQISPCYDPNASLFSCISNTLYNIPKSLWSSLGSIYTHPIWSKLHVTIFSSPPDLSKLDVAGLDLTRLTTAQLNDMMSNVQLSLSEKESKKREIENESKLDFGPGNVWVKEKGRCLTSDVVSGGCVSEFLNYASVGYTYEVCLHEKAYQISGSHKTSLGIFGGFGTMDSSESSNQDYTKMHFKAGEQCWNGPARSLQVEMECDSEWKIETVSEPSKCEYWMKLKTPLVCKEPNV